VKRFSLAALAAVATALVTAGCGGTSDSTSNAGASSSAGSGSSAKLALVAYSTPQVVYDDAIPAFEKTAAGKGVSFTQSYGASGDQSRAVAAGLPADIVTFSLAPDVDKLVQAGLVKPSWTSQPHGGFVSRSVVALVVRKGNPKGIHGWADLLKPGIKVVTPNPFTSGSAKWNLLAAYGAASNGGKSPAKGLAYIRQLLTQRVVVQPKSGRDALQTFTSGEGDVLISYENEAITAQQKGQAVDYVIPSQTILIENPIAVVAKTKYPAQARAFLSYLWSTAGQTTFAKHGYRPVDPAVAAKFASRFPKPKQLFTIASLGGWSKVNKAFFDPSTGSVAKIEQAAGVPTAK
jgi:sulfate transport system substrate-binding protein